MSVIDIPARLPRLILAALSLGMMAHSYSISSLFSFAGIMCVDLGWAQDRDKAGFVAGFIQASNTLARIPTSPAWACFVDRYGLRSAMLSTMACLCVGGIAFGSFVSLPMVLLMRCLFQGVGNGWVVISGPLFLEVAGAERQTEVMGIVLACGGFVDLLGPALAGWTYGLTPQLPAFVPSSIASIIALAGFLSTWCWLPCSFSPGSSKVAEAPGDDTQIRIFAWPMPLVLSLRSLRGFAQFSMFELMPLWAISAPALGGLGVSQRELGSMLSASAFGTLLFTAKGMPILSKQLGLRKASTFAGLLSCAATMALPCCSSKWSATIMHMLTSMASSLIVGVSIATTNNAAPQGARARVSGIAVMLEACAKGVAPIASATFFAWTLQALGFYGHFVAFFTMSGMYLLYACGTCCLPASVENDGRAVGKAFCGCWPVELPTPAQNLKEHRRIGKSASAEEKQHFTDAETGVEKHCPVDSNLAVEPGQGSCEDESRPFQL